jgi:ribonuclease-3
VGGIYKDQGAEVVSKWLISLLRPHVEDAYRSVQEYYLLPSDSETWDTYSL